jgi:hypothetical protein
MRSPLKNEPLRNPGQSLDRYLLDVVFEESIIYILTGSVVCLFVFNNWIYYLTEKVPNPWAMTLIAVAVVAYCLYKIKKALKKITKLKQGRDGEKSVGQYLESLREQGVKVFHDLPGDNFNLDHVLVAPSGVEGISCPHCFDTHTLDKRQRQMELSKDRGEAHIGADAVDTIAQRRQAKEQKKQVQRDKESWFQALTLSNRQPECGFLGRL